MARQQLMIGLVSKNSPDYVTLFFDLVRNGDIVVPVRRHDDHERIAHLPVAKVVEPVAGGGWIAGLGTLPDDDLTAQIAFTSGTEGEPKGVVLTNANLADTVRRLIDVMALDSSVREYVAVPVYHSFGLGRCRAIAATGGQCYIPEHGFNYREFARMLAAGEVNSLSIVPTLLRVILANPEAVKPFADRLRWIEIGSQSLALPEKRAIRALFPNARIFQHYGLTEASRATMIDISSSNEDLASVGRPSGHVEVKITEQGRIAIRGNQVAREIIVRGIRRTSVDADGWLETSDLGFIRDGLLYFNGRADDIINCGGVKVSPDELEQSIAARIGGSDDLAIVRIPDASRGDGVLIALRVDSPRAERDVWEATQSALADLGLNATSSIRLWRPTEFPVTDAGKIRRAELARQFLDVAMTPAAVPAATIKPIAAAPQRPDEVTTILDMYRRIFPMEHVTDQSTFIELGGDSLNFVEVSYALEDLLGHLPEDWQRRTVAELQTVGRPRSIFHQVDTTLIIRALAITAVVTYHFSDLSIGGSAFLLMLVAGYNFSRFMIPKVIVNDSAQPILTTAIGMAVPLYLVLISREAWHSHFTWQDLALLGNFMPAATDMLDYWFVEVLVQLLVLLAALLSLPVARRTLACHPLAFSAATLGLGLLTTRLAPHVWDTTIYFDRLPHMLLWLFAAGWVMEVLKRQGQPVIAFAIAMAAPAFVWGLSGAPFYVGHSLIWIFFGSLLLLTRETIPVPAPLNTLAYWVGGASMFIYVTHWSVQGIAVRLTGSSSSLLLTVTAIVFGVLTWLVWQNLTRFLAKQPQGIHLKSNVRRLLYPKRTVAR